MNTDKSEFAGHWGDERTNGISEKILGAAYKVSNVLGCGFLEKVYENAMAIELTRQGLQVHRQFPIPVYYESVQVGDYYADLLVDNTVIVELKAADRLSDTHQAQCLNYLKGTGMKLCLLLNFGRPRVEVKRLMR